MTTDRLAALIHEIDCGGEGVYHDLPGPLCVRLAARLAAAGVRLDITCECGHPDLCTPAYCCARCRHDGLAGESR